MLFLVIAIAVALCSIAHALPVRGFRLNAASNFLQDCVRSGIRTRESVLSIPDGPSAKDPSKVEFKKIRKSEEEILPCLGDVSALVQWVAGSSPIKGGSKSTDNLIQASEAYIPAEAGSKADKREIVKLQELLEDAYTPIEEEEPAKEEPAKEGKRKGKPAKLATGLPPSINDRTNPPLPSPNGQPVPASVS